MYQRIVTYNFENDDTRELFVDLLIGLGFEVQPDQSTYAQRNRNPDDGNELVASITRWSRNVELSADDHVEIYYLCRVDRNNMLINRYDMQYNARNREIR